jgi:hypothetical protein
MSSQCQNRRSRYWRRARNSIWQARFSNPRRHSVSSSSGTTDQTAVREDLSHGFDEIRAGRWTGTRYGDATGSQHACRQATVWRHLFQHHARSRQSGALLSPGMSWEANMTSGGSKPMCPPAPRRPSIASCGWYYCNSPVPSPAEGILNSVAPKPRARSGVKGGTCSFLDSWHDALRCPRSGVT